MGKTPAQHELEKLVNDLTKSWLKCFRELSKTILDKIERRFEYEEYVRPLLYADRMMAYHERANRSIVAMQDAARMMHLAECEYNGMVPLDKLTLLNLVAQAIDKMPDLSAMHEPVEEIPIDDYGNIPMDVLRSPEFVELLRRAIRHACGYDVQIIVKGPGGRHHTNYCKLPTHADVTYNYGLQHHG